MDAGFGSGASVAWSDVAPVAEVTVAAAGAQALASRGDHAHPRLTSTTVQNTASDGTATVPFTRTFTKKPGVILTPHGASAGGQPLQWEVTAFQQDASLNYISVTVKFYRAQTVPQNLVSLLVGAVYNIFGGAVGVVEFTCVAIAASN